MVLNYFQGKPHIVKESGSIQVKSFKRITLLIRLLFQLKILMAFLSGTLLNLIFLSTIALFSEYDKMSKREKVGKKTQYLLLDH